MRQRHDRRHQVPGIALLHQQGALDGAGTDEVGDRLLVPQLDTGAGDVLLQLPIQPPCRRPGGKAQRFRRTLPIQCTGGVLPLDGQHMILLRRLFSQIEVPGLRPVAGVPGIIPDTGAVPHAADHLSHVIGPVGVDLNLGAFPGGLGQRQITAERHRAGHQTVVVKCKFHPRMNTLDLQSGGRVAVGDGQRLGLGVDGEHQAIPKIVGGRPVLNDPSAPSSDGDGRNDRGTSHRQHQPAPYLTAHPSPVRHGGQVVGHAGAVQREPAAGQVRQLAQARVGLQCSHHLRPAAGEAQHLIGELGQPAMHLEGRADVLRVLTVNGGH